MESHTPSNSKIRRINITAATSKTNVGKKESIAETFPSDKAVNMAEANTLVPTNRKLNQALSCSFSTVYRSHSSGVGISPSQGIFLHCARFSGFGLFHPFSIQAEIIVRISSTVIFRSRARHSNKCSSIVKIPCWISFPSVYHTISVYVLFRKCCIYRLWLLYHCFEN